MTDAAPLARETERLRGFWRFVTSRSNSLVGRLIRLAAAWFIFMLVMTGIALTYYFHETALRRFELGVGQIADNLYVDTDVASDGHIVTPPFFDTRTNRVVKILQDVWR